MRSRSIRYLALSTLMALGLLVLTAFVSINASDKSAATEPARPATAVVSLRTGNNGLSFVLTTPPFQEEETGKIIVSGLDQQIREPGAPALPYFSTLVALPPGADVTVDSAGSSTERRLPRCFHGLA